MYNPYNLEASTLETILVNFKAFLRTKKISNGSTRSYLSDTRHFLVWLEEFLKASHILNETHPNPPLTKGGQTNNSTIVLKHVNVRVLEAYKDYLLTNYTPLKSINRAFSSLRRFGEFLKSQSYPSYFDTLRNISLNQPFPEDQYHLGEFKAHLWKNKSSQATIKNYMNDVKQFLNWEVRVRNGPPASEFARRRSRAGK